VRGRGGGACLRRRWLLREVVPAVSRLVPITVSACISQPALFLVKPGLCSAYNGFVIF